MDPLFEYAIKTNAIFYALLIAGAVFLAILILSILYYVYIEKTNVILFINLYFLFALLGLIVNSLFALTLNDTISYTYQRLLYNLKVILDFLLIYSIYLFTRFYAKPYKPYVDYIVVLCIPLLYLIGRLTNHLWLVFFLYLYAVFSILVYRIRYRIKESNRFSLAFIILYLVITSVYYIISYGQYLNIINVIIIECIAVCSVALVLITFFMHRYRILVQDKEQLYQLLIVDDLTKLYSKNYFQEQLDQKDKGIVFFIDINNFKNLNDNKGHHLGDALLSEFAGRITGCFEGDVLSSRYGGDEIVILSDQSAIESAQFSSLELINQFKESLKVLKLENEEIGISIGISVFNNGAGKKALNNADSAMYKAKKLGNNKIVVEY